MGGMRTNIEASVMQDFDTAEQDNVAFLDDLEAKLNAMIVDYPQHVIRAVDAAQLVNLQRSGRLLDERKARPPEAAGASADRSLDTVPIMALKTAPIRLPRPTPPPAPPVAPAAPAAMVARERLEQVWESNGLTRRHLNIPDGENTNPTGSMLLGVGAWDGIDQRHYFHDQVFSGLEWIADAAPRTAHIERAEASIRLIIKDVDYGVHTLQISHNTKTDTAAYEQRNSMTSLHWGDARTLIAHEDLLGRVLRLFRATDDLTRFTLEID